MKITHKALDRIDLILNGDGMGLVSQPFGKVFRVALEGGGCTGFKYVFEVSDTEDGDIVPENRVAVDPISATFLENAELDFKQDVFQSSFVINNPDVKSTCGCGESIGF